MKLKYEISTPDRSWKIEFAIDPDIGIIPPEKNDGYGAWTLLEVGKCPHCPLTNERRCPVAKNIDTVLSGFRELASFDEVDAKVTLSDQTETTTTAQTTAQQILSNLVGAIIASSTGCPHTHFLKPMVLFHRPFASQDESIYRALANIALYYQQSNTAESFTAYALGLYKNLHTVNVGLVHRIRDVDPSEEALINAFINLDTFVKGVIYNIESNLQ